MSADIQAPGLSLNGRYNRGDEKNGGEKEESQVEIYENEVPLKHSHTDLWSHKFRPLNQNNLSTVTRSHYATASILGGLYLLISAGIIMRYVLVTLDNQILVTERDQLNISLNQALSRNLNLTEERDELQTRYDILSKNYNQLQQNMFMDKLKEKFFLFEREILVKERDQLNISLNHAQSRNLNLTNQRRADILRRNCRQLEGE